MSAPSEPGQDVRWMERALELAARGMGTTSPNPMVGAVLVRDGRAVGEGFHECAGGPHAEIFALREAGEAARGADLYVTLEPCSHHGRTGPCADALIAAGVARVFVGAGDPNPLVAGGGVARLRAAGVEVTEGLLEERCHALNEVFEHWITTRTPLVTLKLACSLDGRIAASTGVSRWITGEAARARVHELRSLSDAVMVGSGTALADDPRLNVRSVATRGEQPVRIIVDSKLRVPLSARVLDSEVGGPTIVATAAAEDDPRFDALSRSGATVWSLPGVHDGRVDLRALLTRLGERADRPITSLLVEGGGVLAGGLVRERLAHRLHLFYAPCLMGGDGLAAVAPLGVVEPASAPQIALEHVGQVGKDIEISGRFVY